MGISLFREKGILLNGMDKRGVPSAIELHPPGIWFVHCRHSSTVAKFLLDQAIYKNNIITRFLNNSRMISFSSEVPRQIILDLNHWLLYLRVLRFLAGRAEVASWDSISTWYHLRPVQSFEQGVNITITPEHWTAKRSKKSVILLLLPSWIYKDYLHCILKEE